MNYFLYRLNPPRPTFMMDMTVDERKIMDEHISYWKDLIDKGTAIIFGPVIDPKGVWGAAVFKAEDAAAAETICANDPAITASAGLSMEVFPMPQTVVRE